MRLRTHIFSLTAAAGAMALLLLCPALQATGIILTGDVNFAYNGLFVPPYLATLGGAPNVLVYCLDAHIDTAVNREYTGSVSFLNVATLSTLTADNARIAEEVAFLAAYALYANKGVPGAAIATVDGPIAMAIWQLMGTLGSTPLDPLAAAYIQTAQNAFTHNLIPQAFLDKVSIWSPDSSNTSQRFMTAIRDDVMVGNAVPEPGSVLLMGIGVLLVGLGRFRRRR